MYLRNVSDNIHICAQQQPKNRSNINYYLTQKHKIGKKVAGSRPD
jgi:antirestriction protein ArdC